MYVNSNKCRLVLVSVVYLLAWSVIGQSFPSYLCLTPTLLLASPPYQQPFHPFLCPISLLTTAAAAAAAAIATIIEHETNLEYKRYDDSTTTLLINS